MVLAFLLQLLLSQQNAASSHLLLCSALTMFPGKFLLRKELGTSRHLRMIHCNHVTIILVAFLSCKEEIQIMRALIQLVEKNTTGKQ